MAEFGEVHVACAGAAWKLAKRSLGQGESALAAEAVVGYAIYKAAAPVRWPLTAGVTATVARLRKK